MLIGAIILAGGSSERMGQSKPALPWGDSTMLLERIETMLQFAGEVVVVARDADQELPPLHTECDLVFDPEPGAGPLGAILAGMKEVARHCEAALVVGCDFPFFDERAARFVSECLGEKNGAVPQLDGTPQPLCAIYRTLLIPEIEAALADGAKAANKLLDLRSVVTIDEATIRAFDADARFLFNVNTPEDYEQAKQWKS